VSCHGNALHPDKARAQRDAEVSRKTILLAEKLGIPWWSIFRVSGRFTSCHRSQLGDLPVASGISERLDWQWNEVVGLIGRSTRSSPPTTG